MQVPFSHIEWDETTVRLPSDPKLYRMRNLATVEENVESSTKQYVLVDSRNKKRICLIDVDSSDDYLFRQFQNRLLRSKFSNGSH